MRFTLAEMDHQNGVHFKTEKSGLEAVRVYVRVRRNPECPGICAQLLRHFLDPVTRLLSVNIGSDVNNDNLASGSMFMTREYCWCIRLGHDIVRRI